MLLIDKSYPILHDPVVILPTFRSMANERMQFTLDLKFLFQAKLHETEFEVANYHGRQVPLEDKIEKECCSYNENYIEDT